MTYCPNCGTKRESSKPFCFNCGLKFKEDYARVDAPQKATHQPVTLKLENEEPIKNLPLSKRIPLDKLNIFLLGLIFLFSALIPFYLIVHPGAILYPYKGVNNNFVFHENATIFIAVLWGLNIFEIAINFKNKLIITTLFLNALYFIGLFKLTESYISDISFDFKWQMSDESMFFSVPLIALNLITLISVGVKFFKFKNYTQ